MPRPIRYPFTWEQANKLFPGALQAFAPKHTTFDFYFSYPHMLSAEADGICAYAKGAKGSVDEAYLFFRGTWKAL